MVTIFTTSPKFEFMFWQIMLFICKFIFRKSQKLEKLNFVSYIFNQSPFTDKSKCTWEWIQNSAKNYSWVNTIFVIFIIPVEADWQSFPFLRSFVEFNLWSWNLFFTFSNISWKVWVIHLDYQERFYINYFSNSQKLLATMIWWTGVIPGSVKSWSINMFFHENISEEFCFLLLLLSKQVFKQ